MARAVRKFVVTHLWWLVLVIALGLLVSHTFSVRRIAVDNTSLILLVLILISPFVAAIKKVKIGEFEAEIEPEEVKRVTESAEQSLPTVANIAAPLPRQPGDPVMEIRALADTDPIIALAKLRIEFEKRLRQLHDRVGHTKTPKSLQRSLSNVIRELVAREVLPLPLGHSLGDVIAICNRAIHGEDIRETDAKRMIAIGAELLEVLDGIVREYGAIHPVEEVIITPQARDDLQGATYRLTTVVPLVENPRRKVYVVTQEQLDQLLEGYSEYAEFMVGLERIGASVKQ